MRSLPFIVMLLFILLVGCRKNRPIDPLFPWPASGVPVADSLLLSFEKERRFSDDHESIGTIMNQFDLISRHYEDNNLIQFRNFYMKSYCMFLRDNDSLDLTLKTAYDLIDSTRYPYDWHVISSFAIELNNDVVNKYNMIKENIDFFHKNKSPIEEGRNLMFAGDLLTHLGDKKSAMEYYRRAETIFTRYDYGSFLDVVKINIANCISPSAEDSVLMSLIYKMSAEDRSDGFMVYVYHNSFLHHPDSVGFLDKAISLSKKGRLRSKNLPYLIAMKGDYFTKHGNPEVGLKYINEAFDSLDISEVDKKFVSSMHYLRAHAFYECEKYDSSVMALTQSIDCREKSDKELNMASVLRLDGLNRIKMARQEERIEKYRLSIILCSVIMALVIAMLVIMMRVKKKEAEKKMEQLQYQQQMERAAQSVRAQAMVMEETDKLVAEITERVDSLKDRKTIDSASADAISKMLKIHKSNEQNRQSYLQMQNELDMEFQQRLRQDFQSLTDAQLKLASLTAIGLDTRQICGILNIEPTSVHKSRYRLRLKLGLTGDQDLEDFLRKYNRKVVE